MADHVGIHHLRAGGVSLVLDARGHGLPAVLHWGEDLGEVEASALEALALVSVAPGPPNTLDDVPTLSLLPEHARGWFGQPGLVGHRAGRTWSPRLDLSALDVGESDGVHRLSARAGDDEAALSARVELELGLSGLLRMRADVTNENSDEEYQLDALHLALPVPGRAEELLDLTGGHIRERSPQRQPFHVGSRVRDNRRGRTGTDATLVVVAGTGGFGFGTGEVWGLHVGWSGNHRTYAERLSTGEAVLGGGELLLPGEVRLPPGERYVSPWLYASYGRGLDEMAARFHSWLRARPEHPTHRKPRPVVLNTWEAVYFDHDLDRLRALADAAAEVGAERYVLDDGWFRHRRDDSAGLGDWYVDEDVYPKGLHPLVDHVRSRGLEFGLWVEPEMVNPDSDLARAHPEWLLATGHRLPLPSRRQQVLDLGNPEAYAYILERLDALLTEYAIGYLKWDHNRDLLDAGHGPGGEPGVHEQTLAVYRLIDELRSRHPDVEIESCSSGGGRVDLGILSRTDRIWASDCNDALERQKIQRWTGLLVPPEMVGSHVGPPHSHTTGRRHDLPFRAGTAFFGHLGIEWDISSATPEERAELARWVALHRRFRDLLHSGRVVRSDHPDPGLWVHGVVADDASEAVYALVSMQQRVWVQPGRIQLPGLDADATYQLDLLAPGGSAPAAEHDPPPWPSATPLELPGSVLRGVGVQVPNLYPEQLLLLHVVATDQPGDTHRGEEAR